MKILLVGVNSKYIHPNVALRFLSGYAKKVHNNIDIDILEFTIKDSVTDIVNTICTNDYDLIGISAYIWNITLLHTIIPILKGNMPATKIVLGGPEVSYNPKEVLTATEADFVICGEGELGFSQLITVLQTGYATTDRLLNVPSIAFLDNGKLFKANENIITTLDVLPSVYINSNLDEWNNKLIYIESTRGCPYSCSFCVAGLENNVRFYKPERIFEEITFLQTKSAKTFKFLDRTFNVNKKHMLSIFKWIIQNHRKGSVFQFEISLATFPMDVIDYLNQFAPVGLFRFEVGIQSLNDTANLSTCRKQDNELLIKKIKALVNGGRVILHVDLIAGLPSESISSFASTFDKTFLLYAPELQLGFLKLLHGTSIRENASKFGYTFSEQPPYEVFSNNFISEKELTDIHAVEEVLEKYYNAPRLKNTFIYLFSQYKVSPFAFFLEYGKHYEKLYSWQGTQLTDLYLRFNTFLQVGEFSQDNVLQSFIKLDYLLQHKIKPKIWWSKLEKSLRNDLIREYYKFQNTFKINYLFKHAVVFESQYDFNMKVSRKCYVIGLYIENKFTYTII